MINQTPIQHKDRQVQDLDSTPKIQMTSSEEDWFNESIIILLSRQQDLQKQLLDMMQIVTRWHEYDNSMRYITIYDRKNMDLAD